jgi:cyclic beta-1,2-glucan synthetase
LTGTHDCTRHTDYDNPVQEGRVIIGNDDAVPPVVQLLSNGRYHVMVTSAGGGYSSWRHLALTRWHEDATRDNWGAFCYLRDLASGNFWSTAYQPALERPDTSETVFSTGRAVFHRRDHGMETRSCAGR